MKKKASKDMVKHEIPLDKLQALSPENAKLILYSIEEKKAWFEHQLKQLRISYFEDSITLVIDREHTLRDSFEQFRTTDRFDLHKELKIHYVGERAQDAGGVLREWVTELTKTLFGGSHSQSEEGVGFFMQLRSQSDLTYFPNPRARHLIHSSKFHKAIYRFAGGVLAKAIFEKIPVNIKLHPVMLKRLTANSQKIKVEDLRDFDEQIYKSLIYMATDPTVDLDLLELKFSMEAEDGQEIELIENGKNIDVTSDNIEQYCQAVAKYYLIDQVKEEAEEFMAGFYQVIPRSILSIF